MNTLKSAMRVRILFVWMCIHSFFGVHANKPVLGQQDAIAYTLLPCSEISEGVLVRFSFSTKDEKPLLIRKLLQQSLFNGTESFDRITIENILNGLNLDIEAESFWENGEYEDSLEFCLQKSDDSLFSALTLMNQVLFSPLLTDMEVEIARFHLLDELNSIGQEEIKKQKIADLHALSVEILRDYYSEWIKTVNMSLAIVGSIDFEETQTMIHQIFNTTSKIIQTNESNDPLLQSMRLNSTTPRTWLIDEKIWMNEPNWINKKQNGRGLGGLLTIGGIACLAATPFIAPAAAPISIVSGGITAATGLYFIFKNYFKDPVFLDLKRQQDLRNGTARAYMEGRAGLTLTPMERRALFLEEMVNHPEKLPEKPVILLADTYRLNDPIVSEMFSKDEYTYLCKFKTDFIHRRNQYKMLKRNLQSELASLTSQFAVVRDNAINMAQHRYNQDYFVQSKKSHEAARDKRYKDIKELYEGDDISDEEKDAYTRETEEYYAALLGSPEFISGLSNAQMARSYAINEAEATFSLQVEQCKSSIRFNQRMVELKDGKNSLIYYANRELVENLRNFPLYPGLADYLDHRT